MQLLKHDLLFWHLEQKELYEVFAVDFVARMVNFEYPTGKQRYNQGLNLDAGVLIRHTGMQDITGKPLREYDMVVVEETAQVAIVYMSKDWGGWALWNPLMPEGKRNISLSTYGIASAKVRSLGCGFQNPKALEELGITSLMDIEHVSEFDREYGLQ